MTDHREADEETEGWEFGLTTIGGGNGRIRLRGDQEIFHEDVEHGRAVYCDAINFGPL